MTALCFTFLFLLASPLWAARTMFSGATSIEEIDRRLKRLPEEGELRKKAYLHSDRGTLLYRQGRMTEASEEFERALTFRTTRHLRRHIYLFLGKSYESSGRLDKAIFAYEEALRYDDRNWRRHRDLAGLYERAKLYRKAREFYASARELNPREPSLYFVTGRVHRKMGLFKEAEPYLEKAEHLGHDDNAIHREMSMVKERRGAPQEALTHWVKGAGRSEAPEDLARLIYLAVQAGDKQGALKAFGRLKGAGASPQTLNLYENLVEWDPSGLEALLSFRGKYPELEALVGSFLAERKTP